jgi:putative ABC transport system permease protein
MTFLSLILKNLWRQRTRTLLTLLGVSIGIATIIALGSISAGIKTSMSSFIQTGKADFVVAQANVSDFVLSAIDEQRLDDLRAMPGVANVQGSLLGAIQVGSNPLFLTFGSTPEAAALNGFRIYEGRMFDPAEDEIILGKLGALSLKKRVGDSVDILGRKFTVVGLYQCGDSMQDGAAVVPLSGLQDLTKRVGKVTMAFIRVAPGTDIGELASRIEKQYPGELVTVRSIEEVSRVEKSTQAIEAGTTAISALAILVGGIGVMNTMIVSVYDRVREIGVLKALGWRRGSIVRMILGEATLVGVGAMGLGSVLGLAMTKAVLAMPMVKSLVTPTFSADLWLRALIVSISVALLGGIYPAFRAASLSPIEALRYE